MPSTEYTRRSVEVKMDSALPLSNTSVQVRAGGAVANSIFRCTARLGVINCRYLAVSGTMIVESSLFPHSPHDPT